MKDIGLEWNKRKCSVAHVETGTLESEKPPTLRLQQGAGFKSVCDAGAKLLDATQCWPIAELKRLDREAREVIVENGGKHPLGSTALVYLPRGLGGRGLNSVEREYKQAKIKAAVRLSTNEDPAVEVVRRFQERSEEMGQRSRVKDAKKYISEFGLNLSLVHPQPLVTCLTNDLKVPGKKIGMWLKTVAKERDVEELRAEGWQGPLLTERWEDQEVGGEWCSSMSECKTAPTHTIAGLLELYQQLLPTKVYHQKRRGTHTSEDVKCRMCEGRLQHQANERLRWTEQMNSDLLECKKMALELMKSDNPPRLESGRKMGYIQAMQARWVEKGYGNLALTKLELYFYLDTTCGGRGVKSVEAEYKQTKIKSAVKLYGDEDPTMGLVRAFEEKAVVKGHRPLVKEAGKFAEELGVSLNLSYPKPKLSDEEGKEVSMEKIKNKLNRGKKDEEKTLKYGPLRWEMKAQYKGYNINQYNVIMDVLGGWSVDMERSLRRLLGSRCKEILRLMQRSVISTQHLEVQYCDYNNTNNNNSYPPDIVALSETWLRDQPQLLNYVFISGFVTELQNREGIRGGDIEKAHPELEHLWIEVPGRNKYSRAPVGVIYNSKPMLSPSDWLNSLENLLGYLTVCWDGMLMLTGDINIDMLRPSDHLTKRYQGILDTFELTQIMKRPSRVTRTSKTLIDHFIINHPQKMTNTGIIPCSIVSDHDAIYACINVRLPRFQPCYKFIRDIRNFNENVFKGDFSTLPLSVIYYSNDPDEQLETLNTLISECLERHAPLRKVRVTRPPAPWMKDPLIEELQKKRDSARFTAHQTSTDAAWHEFRSVRNKLKSAIRTVGKAFIEKALHSNKSRKAWKVIHRVLKPSARPLQFDPDELNDFFTTTGQRTLETRATPIEDLTCPKDNLPDVPSGGHSTTTAFMRVRDDIRYAMERKDVTLMVLADFFKAFHAISYRATIVKFYKLAFSKPFLSHFNVKELDSRAVDMNETLLSITNWSQDSNLALNPTKTKCMLFSTPQMSSPYHSLPLTERPIHLSVGDKPLERFHSIKLLGVHMTDTLKWDDHVKHRASSCYGALAAPGK
ncbi:hypothetical protein AWC38_SpisGene10518 [Stylophora pistillata]|uniref:Reverse transcriptase domain-containing protein n=1 Tax=Stylophora pistillata TaxID=50429 RepID=A0A2B4S663_STYPI|nr:hypothetical protein AWC38_SpisGene10518 [Stylophora pistillata]